MDVRRKVTIVNSAGLHARPCHAIVAAANTFSSTFQVGFEGRMVNGKSILQLMTLVAGPGAELELCCEGDDAESLADAVAELIERGFGEST
ncbi:MAG: phosphocarrier protein HPr [Planctomycetota bacterium]|jgi:phosphocarrier protein HPr